MLIKGSCLCKAVTYEIAGPFKMVGNCHCSLCRKAHGAAFVTWGIIGPEQFRWLCGEEAVHGFESSAGVERCFCRQCGSSLVVRHAGRVGEVALSTVDGDPGMQPGEHIFVGSKAPWFHIADQLPQHLAWPPGMDAAG